MNRLVLLLATLLCFCSCSSGGGSTTTVTITVNENGGLIEAFNGALKILIPAGALTAQTEINLSRLDKNLLSEAIKDKNIIHDAFEISPASLVFQKEITVSLLSSTASGENFASPITYLIIKNGNTYTAPASLTTDVDFGSSSVYVGTTIQSAQSILLASPKESPAGIQIENLPGALAVNEETTVLLRIPYAANTMLHASRVLFHNQTPLPVSYGLGGDVLLGALNPSALTPLLSDLPYTCIASGKTNFSLQVTFEDFDISNLLGSDASPFPLTYTFTKGITCGDGTGSSGEPLPGAAGCHALSGFAFTKVEGDCDIDFISVNTLGDKLVFPAFGTNSDVVLEFFTGSDTSAFTQSRNLSVNDDDGFICTIGCNDEGTAFSLGCSQDDSPNTSCDGIYSR